MFSQLGNGIWEKAWRMERVNGGKRARADVKQSSLARLAYSHYSKEYLWQCTLVSTWEPCAMCSGKSFRFRCST
jgi:hypothetical protein